MNDWLILLPALAWAAALCCIDCRSRTLPNFLTLGGAALALLLRAGLSFDLFIDGLIGAAIGAAFLLLPFLARAAGGGDLKMCLAVGAMIGARHVLYALWITAIAGLVMSAVMLLCGAVNSARIRHYFRAAFDPRYDRAAGKAALPSRDDERVRMPFSIPIACGLLITLAW